MALGARGGWTWVGFAVICAACGSPSPEVSSQALIGDPSAIAALDQSFTIGDEVAYRGVWLRPRALGRPGMVRVEPASKRSLAIARKRAARRGAKASDVHVLVTMLWDAAAAAESSSADTATGLRAEAFDSVRRLYRAGESKADAVTLQMLAASAVWMGDLELAQTSFSELVARFPSDPNHALSQSWLAAICLQRGELTKAAEHVSAAPVAEMPEFAAYVLAWTRFRQRDYAASVAAMERAASGWKATSREGVIWELVLMLARAGVPARDATAMLEHVTGTRDPWAARLVSAYKVAGHYQLASEVIDETLDSMPAAEQVAQRFEQADLQFRLAKPKQAAGFAIAAHGGLAGCGDACALETRSKVEERVSKLAVFFHGVYHESLDPVFYEAARSLYQYQLDMGRGSAAGSVRSNMSNLADAHDRADRAAGRHSEQVMTNFVLVRREALGACYEAVLTANPELVGTIDLTLDVEHTGEVIGGATEPAAGAEGMSAVAGCVVQAVKQWRFPSRTVPGHTQLNVKLAFSPRDETDQK